LANGLNDGVYAIYYNILLNRLYAGGKFTQDGFGTSMQHISYFNFVLNRWVEMGLNNGTQEGLDGNVYAITSLGTNEYIGGEFKSDNNGILLNRITRYNSLNDTFNPLIGITYGVNNTVYSIAYDGSQYFYVGGNFQSAGGQQANNIARFDRFTNKWEPLFDSNTNRNGVDGTVYTIFYDSSTNRVYVGGTFLKVSGRNFYNIAYWDPANITWKGVGTFSTGIENGTNGTVFTIIKDTSSLLYVGGSFNSTDYTGINLPTSNKFYNLATWDGSNWGFIGSSLQQNGTNNIVHALFYESSSNRLYVGGDFTSVDYTVLFTPLAANYIAYWNYTSWFTISQSFGNGTNSSVNAITGNSVDKIFIGGNFTLVEYDGGTNGISANYIVTWNQGTNAWEPLNDGGNPGNGLNGIVNTLYYDNDILYIGGLFTLAYLDFLPPVQLTKGPYYNSVKWFVSANTWQYIGVSQLINGVNGQVFSIFYDNVQFYTFMGGNLSLAGYDGANGFTEVNNITFFDGGAKWNQLVYNNYDIGVDRDVFALTVIGNDIYVGGNFTITGPNYSQFNVCNYIAKWSTINEVWYPLICDTSAIGEIGMSGPVRALATNGTLLFVGGEFTNNGGTSQSTSGSINLNYIGIWNPTLETWTQIITNPNIGLDNFVLGLSYRTPYDILYLSGDFTASNGGAIQLAHIAQFNLSDIGTQIGFKQIIDSNGNYGTNAKTNTILNVYPRIYFGGEFTSNFPSGSVSMNYLGYYLYIYVSPEVILIIPDYPNTQFLDTQTGTISQTYTLTNRFKSVILISCQEPNISPLKYWLIMYRS
jgi:hypothetical protein